MALLALILLQAAPPLNLPWADEVNLVRAEVNGLAAVWGRAETPEAPAAAARRLRVTDGWLVAGGGDRIVAWRGNGMKVDKAGMRSVLRRHGGALAVRVADRTGVPVVSEIVWFVDTACALGIVKGKGCFEADMEALAAVVAAALPKVSFQSVSFVREGGRTRVRYFAVAEASPAPLLALLTGGDAALCRRVPYPVPSAARCPLVVRLGSGDTTRVVALVAVDGDAGLAFATRALQAAGWRETEAALGDLRRFRRKKATLDVALAERAGAPCLLYLSREAP